MGKVTGQVGKNKVMRDRARSIDSYKRGINKSLFRKKRRDPSRTLHVARMKAGRYPRGFINARETFDAWLTFNPLRNSRRGYRGRKNSSQV